MRYTLDIFVPGETDRPFCLLEVFSFSYCFSKQLTLPRYGTENNNGSFTPTKNTRLWEETIHRKQKTAELNTVYRIVMTQNNHGKQRIK